MEICSVPVRDASAWTRSDMHESEWLYTLDAEDLADIDAARRAAEQKGLAWGGFGRGDFPLGETMKAKLAQALARLMHGRGIVVFRGLKVDNYDLDQLKAIYWGLGVHLGSPRGQNRRGDVIGHVEAVSVSRVARQGDRGYWKPAALPFHTDYCDAVGLLCVRRAKEGGLSKVVSSITLHNHILANRPDFLPALYAGMHTNLRNEGPTRADNEASPTPIPVFEFYRDKLSCFFSKGRYLGGQLASGVTLSQTQLDALEYVSAATQIPEYQFVMDLQPGDFQFLNCHTTLHARTDYSDYVDPDRKRLLLRLWIRFDQEDYRVSPGRSHIFRWGMDQVRPTLV